LTKLSVITQTWREANSCDAPIGRAWASSSTYEIELDGDFDHMREKLEEPLSALNITPASQNENLTS
jgi:hypothetical protein